MHEIVLCTTSRLKVYRGKVDKITLISNCKIERVFAARLKKMRGMTNLMCAKKAQLVYVFTEELRK